MKDFARSTTRSSARSKKSASRSYSRAGGGKRAKSRGAGIFARIAVFLGIIAIFWLALSALNWSDFFGRRPDRTVALITEKVDQTGAFVGRFSFERKQIDLFPIPSEIPVEVMGGYGTYRFQAMYPLLVLEGKDADYIRSTMSLSMGVLLDEVWTVSSPELQAPKKGELFWVLATSFWQNSSIPLGEKLALLSLALDRRVEMGVSAPVRELPALELAGARGEAHSLCTVALVNTTPLSGLAGRIAQLLEQEGFRVVRTVSDSTLVDTTTVLTGTSLSPDCQVVQEKIELLVPGKMNHAQNEEETLRNRADLVVKLGTDLVQ